jgi:spore germination protein GerM
MRRALIWIVILAVVAVGIWWTQVRPQTTPVVVFFVGGADGDGTIVGVERIARGREPEAVLRDALEELLAGPTVEERGRGLGTEIPAGTRLRSLTVREGVAFVDLTEEVGSGGGSASMQGRLWQIVYTATQMGVQQVRILIEGEQRQALGGEGLMIDRPISRPPAYPRF